MTNDEYIAAAVLTKSDEFYGPIHLSRVNPHTKAISIDVLHAILGIATEAGELLDVVKKSQFYGKPADHVNIDEEMGDILWYIAMYCSARNITFENLMDRNIAKLKARFPDRFSTERALHRNLSAERRILEGN